MGSLQNTRGQQNKMRLATKVPYRLQTQFPSFFPLTFQHLLKDGRDSVKGFRKINVDRIDLVVRL